MNRKEALNQMQAVGKDLLAMGLISSHGGNMSVRLVDGGVLITRHGGMLGHIDEGNVVLISPDGAAPGDASMDAGIHLAVYEKSDAGAVLHAHPRHAIALSLAGVAIAPLDLEGQHYLGELVPLTPATEAPATLAVSRVAMTPGHGSYAAGRDLWQALQWTSVLEESAQVLWLLRQLQR